VLRTKSRKMKNLKLTTELSLQLDLLSQGEKLLLSSYDIERNRVFFASSSNLIYTTPLPSSQVRIVYSLEIILNNNAPA
jgi:hypothetical protein